jgi:ABC-type transport system involved in cytochrome c biogenesis permease subunit
MGVSNPIVLSLWSFVGYLIVLILLLVSGFRLRKMVGGFIELKDVFKVLFCSVLIYELFYAVFNFVYLKYINPNFFIHLKEATEAFLIKSGQPQDKIDEMMKGMDKASVQDMHIGDLLKSYLFSISVSGIFALIFSLIIRKKDPFAGEQNRILNP